MHMYILYIYGPMGHECQIHQTSEFARAFGFASRESSASNWPRLLVFSYNHVGTINILLEVVRRLSEPRNIIGA